MKNALFDEIETVRSVSGGYMTATVLTDNLIGVGVFEGDCALIDLNRQPKIGELCLCTLTGEDLSLREYVGRLVGVETVKTRAEDPAEDQSAAVLKIFGTVVSICLNLEVD